MASDKDVPDLHKSEEGTGDPDAHAPEHDTPHEFLRILAGRARTEFELAETTGLEKDQVLETLFAMMRDEWVRKDPSGTFHLTIKGHEYLEEKGEANVSDTLGNRDDRDDNSFNAASLVETDDKGKLVLAEGEHDPTEPWSERHQREYEEGKKDREEQQKRAVSSTTMIETARTPDPVPLDTVTLTDHKESNKGK